MTQTDSRSITHLTPDQLALLPSDEDAAFYREHGWYCSRQVLTAEEVDDALAGADRFYAGDVTMPDVDGLERFRTAGEDADTLRKHDYASLMTPALKRLTTHPVIGAIAARLSGSPAIRLWHDQLLSKPSDRADRPANVGWHTDRQYWMTSTSDEMLTAWVPFHDCDEAKGTITMVDGSHRWADQVAGLDFFSHDLAAMEETMRRAGHDVVRTPVVLKKGQISFHHCRTIHGSGPNRTDSPRRSIAIHLQDDANRYQAWPDASGSIARHGNVELCRKINGGPDFTDPAICPELYREA